MIQLTNSPFLQALGFALINSLWQYALLWLTYFIINTVFKITSRQKFVLGFGMQLCGAVTFIATIAYFSFESNQSSGLYGVINHYSIKSFVFGNTLLFPLELKNALPYFSVVYILVLTGLALKWLKSYHYTQSVKTQGVKKIAAGWKLFVKNVSLQMGINFKVTILLSEIVRTPLTIGFLKPVILIPLASLNRLSTEQMEAVILHELAHIKRCDYFLNLCIALIDIVLFFNPFRNLLSSHIKIERENCCDDWVLQFEYNPKSYAYALLLLANCISTPTLALKAADNKFILLNRIKRMIEKKDQVFFHVGHQLIALIVISIFGGLFVAKMPPKFNRTKFSSIRALNSNKESSFILPDKSKQYTGSQIGKNIFINLPQASVRFSKKNSLTDMNENSPAISLRNLKRKEAGLLQNHLKHQDYNLAFNQITNDDYSTYHEPEPVEPVHDFIIASEIVHQPLPDLKHLEIEAEILNVLNQLKVLQVQTHSVIQYDNLKGNIDQVVDTVIEQETGKVIVLSGKQARTFALKLQEAVQYVETQYIKLKSSPLGKHSIKIPGYTYSLSVPKQNTKVKINNRSFQKSEDDLFEEFENQSDVYMNEVPVFEIGNTQPVKLKKIRL